MIELPALDALSLCDIEASQALAHLASRLDALTPGSSCKKILILVKRGLIQSPAGPQHRARLPRLIYYY